MGGVEVCEEVGRVNAENKGDWCLLWDEEADVRC
jgi:hypothetical protein